jgi:hypothetical protein
MAIGNPLTRFRTVDFFGVLLPGLFIVASLAFDWAAVHATTLDGLVGRIASHLSGTPQWYPVAVTVFTAYVLGSVVRAFPVWRLDDRLAALNGFLVRRSRSRRLKLLYATSYPYPTMLQYDHEELLKAGCISRSNTGPEFDKCHAHIALDYCKEYASCKSPAAALRMQEMEAKTRMFYGMFWAAGAGFVASALFALVRWNALPLLWCGVTLLMGVVFGQRLRFVRGHEARMIYYAYLIQREAELSDAAAADKSGAAQPSVSGIHATAPAL